MKIVDVYFDYKSKYNNYLVLMIIGTFVEVYGDDTTILNNLFDYKIKSYGVTLRSGFPLTSLNKVETKLTQNKVNYIVLNKIEMITKKRFNPNNYDNYKTNISIEKRINRVISKIQKSSHRYDINEILTKIEKLL